MLFFSSKADEKISVMQGFTLWRALSDRYGNIDHLYHMKNFTHDIDFKVYLGDIIGDYEKEVKELEKLLSEYNMPGPEPAVKNLKTVGNSEIVRDRETADVLYKFMRLDSINLILSLKDVHLNDTIRKTILNLTKNSLKRVDKYLTYLNLKNWINIPPHYPYILPETDDKIGLNGIHLLFDHLVFRYQNIRQTQLLSSFVSEVDFLVILRTGMEVLEKEVTQLEVALLKFGVTLPKRYSSIDFTTERKELFEDKFIFNNILRGMQEAVSLRGAAIPEIIINEDLRKFFLELTFSEISLIDKMVKYGRVKGWVIVEPSYDPETIK